MTITSNKRLVSYACLAAFAVLLVLTLLFTTVGFTEGGIDSDNGFTWLTFETNFMESSDTWEYGGVALGIISIAQLILGNVVNRKVFKDQVDQRKNRCGVFRILIRLVSVRS